MGAEEIKKTILKKMVIHRYWGGKHTAYDNLQKGFEPHLIKEVKKVADELIKAGIIIPKPTSYGLHVSLNPRMKELIEKAIEL